MQDTINRIRELSVQIQQVTTILESGEFVAAGLEISLSVGPRSQYEEHSPRYTKNVVDDIVLGVPAGDLSKILSVILTGLKETRKYHVARLNSSVEMARLFLASNEAA